MMKKLLLLSAVLFFSVCGNSQNNEELVKAEDTLKVLGKIILNGESDFIKYDANEKFLTILESALINQNSFDYTFDSLTTIARLVSPDKRFRIFNWNISKTDGTYEYFGFIQAWNKKKKKYILYPLTDNSDKITKPESQNLDNNNWYGAHYYKILYNKSGGKKYYTLLGWDGNDKLTQKKIIDVLVFNSNEKPIFGASIFKYNKKIQKRIIFEYSSTASMSLKYEEQYMFSGKWKRRISFNQEEQYSLTGKKKRKMIIFDRLSPLDQSLDGQYQFYYPETNIFDAFIFRSGKWSLVKDVDARMQKMTREERNKIKKILKEQKDNKRQ
jgi:hypothetical protein